MEPVKLYQKHCEDLEHVMHVKGYRGRFTGEIGKSPECVGDLGAVLRLLARSFLDDKRKGRELVLATTIHASEVNVKFIAQYDPVKGFIVQQQHFAHRTQHPSVIRLRINQEILGSQSVLMRIPRPRQPWEEMLRGRPHWRR